MEKNGEVAFVQEDFTQKHSSVADMFPDLDLTAVIKEYGHTSSEWLINWIVENMSTLPKKQQGVKRKAETSMLAESFDQVESDVVSSDEEENTGSLIRDVMLGEMLTALKSEIHKTPAVDAEKYWDLRELLLDIFPTARAEFIKRIVNAFKGRFVACALACFFVENKLGSKVQKYASELNQAFWIKASKPTNTKRKPKKLGTQECADEMKPELERYQRVMQTFHKKYPEMFEDGKLSKESAQVELDSSNSENKLECPVCLENMPVSKMICCNVDSNANLSSFDQPSTSSETASESVSNDVAGDLSGIIQQEDFSAHTFCRACVRCHAVAATHEIPLADGGVGLKCMVPGCKNPILYSEIRHLLKKDTKKKLDERIIEENLGLASLKNLERCHKCNFPIEMDVPPEVNKVFDCPICNHQFCRLCKSDWDDDHIGITCDELSVKLKKDRKDRNLEQQLNEAIIRKCPQCSIAFTKSEGCNKMTCRCGCTQCYICRETNIKYTHFCQHFREPAKKEAKCKQCDKTCLLWEDSKKLDDQIIENIKKQQQVQQTTEHPAQSSSAFGEREVNAAIDSFLVPLLPNNFANYSAPQLPAGGQQFHRHRPAPDIFADNFGHFDNVGNPFFDADVAEWVNTGGRNRSMNPANQQLQQQLGNPYQPYNNYYDQQPWRNNAGAPFTQDCVNPYAPVQHQQIPQKYGFLPPTPYQMPQNVALQQPQNPYMAQALADQGTSREKQGRRNKAAKPNKYVEAVYNPQVDTFQLSNPGAIPAAAPVTAPNLVTNNAAVMNPQEGAAGPAYPAANGQADQDPQMFVGLMMPPVDNAIAEFDEFLLNYANNPNKEAFQKRRREAQMREWRQKAQQDGQQQPGSSGLNSSAGASGSRQNTSFFEHTGNNNQ